MLIMMIIINVMYSLMGEQPEYQPRQPEHHHLATTWLIWKQIGPNVRAVYDFLRPSKALKVSTMRQKGQGSNIRSI